MEFSQVRWLDDAVGSYLFLNHVTNVALFQCEIVVFLILKPLSIKNLFFWVTWLRGSAKLCLKYSMQKWYRPRELPPPNKWIIFYKLFFFVFKNEIMDQRRKFYSLHLGFVFFGWRHQFSGPMSTIDGQVWMDFTLLKRSIRKLSKLL